MIINYEDYLGKKRSYGLDVDIREWEYNLPEEELKSKKGFLVWYNIYKTNKKLTKEEIKENFYKYVKFREVFGYCFNNFVKFCSNEEKIFLINLEIFGNYYPLNECSEKHIHSFNDCFVVKDWGLDQILLELFDEAEIYYYDKELEKKTKIDKLRKQKIKSGEIKIITEEDKFWEKVGIRPFEFFSNLYRNELIEILNFKEVKKNISFLKQELKKEEKMTEENCLELRKKTKEEIAKEILKNFKTFNEFMNLKNKLLELKRKRKEKGILW